MKVHVYEGCKRGAEVYVYGHEFGPLMLAKSCGIGEAIDEADERFGDRVDFNDTTLLDFKGADVHERIESAMGSGDIRVNDGGTTVWVNPYEWIREFPDEAAALAWLSAEFGRVKPVEFVGA